LAPLTLPVKSEVVSAAAAVESTSRRGIAFLKSILNDTIAEFHADWGGATFGRVSFTPQGEGAKG